MKQQHADYQVVPYPKMRRLEAIAYRSVQHKPIIHGLLEVDVTRARSPQALAEHVAVCIVSNGVDRTRPIRDGTENAAGHQAAG